MPIRISGSYRRYLVADLRPSPDDVAFYETIRENRFRSIDEQAVAEPSIGWVTADTFSSSDFRPETVFLGRTVRLRMRVDVKKVPSNAIRVRLAEALDQMGGRIARSARAQLREEIEKELLGRSVPATAVFDALWRPDDESLLFSSTSNAAHDRFTTLFRETFGVTPVPASPTPLGEKVGAPEVTRERLLRIAPLVPRALEA